MMWEHLHDSVDEPHPVEVCKMYDRGLQPCLFCHLDRMIKMAKLEFSIEEAVKKLQFKSMSGLYKNKIKISGE